MGNGFDHGRHSVVKADYAEASHQIAYGSALPQQGLYPKKRQAILYVHVCTQVLLLSKVTTLRLIVRMSPYIVEIDLFGRNPYK